MIIPKVILKKILIVLLALWLILLGLLYLSSGKYLDHAVGLLRKQFDENLLTEVQIRKDDIHLSFLKNFPNAVLELDKILIKSAPGIYLSEFGVIGSDTLLYAEHLALVFDLRSLFTEKYTLKKIELEDGKLNLLTDSKGNTNYKVYRSERSDSSKRNVEFDLQKIKLLEMHISYVESLSKLNISTHLNDAELAGNFLDKNYEFQTDFETSFFQYTNKKQEIGHKGDDSWDVKIRKDSNILYFEGGEFNVYGINLKGSGLYNLTKKAYSITAETNRASLRKAGNSFSNLLPKGFRLKLLNGDVSLILNISGSRRTNTAIKFTYELFDVSLQDKQSKIKIEKLYSTGSYSNGSLRNSASTLVNIDTLRCKSGSSHLALSGTISNFDKPIIEAQVKAKIGLEKFYLVKSIKERFDISGIISGEFGLKGTLPSFKELKSEALRNVKVNGRIMLHKTRIKDIRSSLPEIRMNGELALQNLADIELNGLKLQSGRSDLLLHGHVINLPLFSSDKTVFPSFKCKVSSNEFHVRDFIIDSKNGDEKDWEINFFDSLIIQANVEVSKFSYGRFQADEVRGTVSYHPKVLSIDDFAMKSQGGEINSKIDIRQVDNKLFSTCKADLKKVDIGDLFYAFHEFKQDVITHEYIDGRLSGSIEVKSAWDLKLKPIYEDLSLESDVTIERGELINYPTLMGLSDFIEVEELKHIKFDHLQTKIAIENEVVKIAQTEINSSAISLTASGNHDFKNKYTYRFQIQLADVIWKNAKRKKPSNNEFGYVVDDGLGRTTLPLKITGVDTKYEVSYDKKTAGSTFRQKLKEERQAWGKLLSSDKNKEIEEDSVVPLEWEDEDPPEKDQKRPLFGREKDENEKEEFQVEWDDE